jgi:uncharacterized cupin superfamily protein
VDHKHTREDEVFMLIKGTALVWYDDQQYARPDGYQVSPEVMAEAAEKYGNVVVRPPR